MCLILLLRYWHAIDGLIHDFIVLHLELSHFSFTTRIIVVADDHKLPLKYYLCILSIDYFDLAGSFNCEFIND